jgi:molybdate transport system ATP-binding protein
MLCIDIQKPLHGSKGEMKLEINIEIEEGTFVALMGESGSGKTTLLRILAGLEKAQGDITIANSIWLDSIKFLAPQKRGIGFVFQDYALFENMSVEENLLYVQNDKKMAKELLLLTGLDALAKRNVKSLSGGQKQRVSLCRAMMNQPKLLLMDEPFSALDERMKQRMINQIDTFHKTYGTTTIMVSHDTDASYLLADRVLLLSQGKVIKDGTPLEVFTACTKVVYQI